MHRNLRTASLSIAAFLALNCPGLSFAQNSPNTQAKAVSAPEKKVDGSWDSLNSSQQKILQPLEDDWNYMTPDNHKRWIQVANIYPKMSEQDQQRLQSRMGSWSNLSQRDRRLARENYLSSLKFPADKKAEAWSAYQKLSQEEKLKLSQSQGVKKTPSVASAPTLQQHPLTSKAILPPAAPIRVTVTPVETIPSSSESNPLETSGSSN